MKKHICIDFEGEGKRGDGTTPHPSLLGALVPNTEDDGNRYLLWVFENRFFNVRPKTKSLVNRRKIGVKDHKLETFVEALMPKMKWPPPPECGVAEACRRLRIAGTRSKKWRNWSLAHQQMAKELTSYNRGDCKAVWKLTNRVNSNYKLRELQ